MRASTTQTGETAERPGGLRLFGAAAAAMLPMVLVAVGLAAALPFSFNA